MHHILLPLLFLASVTPLKGNEVTWGIKTQVTFTAYQITNKTTPYSCSQAITQGIYDVIKLTTNFTTPTYTIMDPRNYTNPTPGTLGPRFCGRFGPDKNSFSPISIWADFAGGSHEYRYNYFRTSGGVCSYHDPTGLNFVFNELSSKCNISAISCENAEGGSIFFSLFGPNQTWVVNYGSYDLNVTDCFSFRLLFSTFDAPPSPSPSGGVPVWVWWVVGVAIFIGVIVVAGVSIVIIRRRGYSELIQKN